MGFEIRAYDELKRDFEVRVEDLLDSKGLTSVEQLPLNRKYQVQFLRTVILKIDKEPAKPGESATDLSRRQARTLTGFLHIIRDDIVQNSNANGVFYKGLRKVMGINEENNRLTANDEISIISCAMQFLEAHVYQGGKTTSMMLENHDFSNIKGLDLPKLMRQANALENAAKDKLVTEKSSEVEKTKMARQEAERKNKSNEGGGILGSVLGFFRGSSEPSDPYGGSQKGTGLY